MRFILTILNTHSLHSPLIFHWHNESNNNKERIQLRIAFIGDLHYPSMIGHNEKVKESRDAFYAKFLNTFFK
ncbi:hypothetical protein J32TS6_40530 [Virgibacillus pantothenticus]|nr:hypothetical protein J32TS6_40530 [Virgibacillus pantothenticus]